MNLDITKFNEVAEAAKIRAANNPAWLRAIDKAARMLAGGDLVVTLFADDTALVTSPNGSYRVNGQCPCAARTSHCYHRAAKRLVEMMETAPVAELVATKAATSARAPRITRSIESDWRGNRYTVTYCDGWSI
jgi:hypothetical protein